MKAADFDQTALDALRGRMQSTDALDAFERLVRYGLESPSLSCAPGGKGRLRDFRYASAEPRGWPFSITTSRDHLLFCIRPLGVRTLRLTAPALTRHVAAVRRRADNGLQVMVRSRNEADALIEHVLSRWPSGHAVAGNGAIADARQGLGHFRSSVEQIEGACRVTGVLDRRHLRAVHIKPWDACDDAERLDGHNGLLLSPHVAHLFERGYISFSDDGQLLVARQLNSTVLKRWAITLPIAARAFVARQKPYLAWHREHVFEKAGAGRRRKG